MFSVRWLAVAGLGLVVLLAECSGQDAASPPKGASASTQPSGAASTTQPGAVATATPALTTKKDIASYALGVQAGRSFKRMKMDLDLALLARGMNDGMADANLLMTDKQVRDAIDFVTNEARLKVIAERTSPVENKREGNKFLAENKTKEGVVTLPSGLQYKILKAGNGPRPGDDDAVECLYWGKLTDGTEFDSTDKTKRPAIVKVSDVILGWQEALKLMPVGSQWEIYVPDHLAYSGRGHGELVGPNATLIYEIHLLSLQAKVPAASQPTAKSE
jgi:FKBP-type peptidyl-prolyl cis-trans isomerase FklB